MCILVSVFRKRGLGLTMWSRPRGLTRQDLQALNIIIINETVYAFQACVRSGSKGARELSQTRGVVRFRR